ncbi:hypothetical protein [uncultured Jatrophihabitans sp.]|uniref:hypothetical protein n=1 Tax=uncultured Jatrophihabitans sp. TaxID=1610747 RepID=UPI0035CA5162
MITREPTLAAPPRLITGMGAVTTRVANLGTAPTNCYQLDITLFGMEVHDDIGAAAG